MLSAFCLCRLSHSTSSCGVLAAWRTSSSLIATHSPAKDLNRSPSRSDSTGLWTRLFPMGDLADADGRRPAAKPSRISVRLAWCVVKSARSRPVTSLKTCFGGNRRAPITTKWLVIGSGSTLRTARTTSLFRRTNGCPAIFACRMIVFSVMVFLLRFLSFVSQTSSVGALKQAQTSDEDVGSAGESGTGADLTRMRSLATANASIDRTHPAHRELSRAIEQGIAREQRSAPYRG